MVIGFAHYVSILERKKHETLYEHFGDIVSENKQFEQSLEDYIETLLMLQHDNRLTFSPLIIKDFLFYICELFIYVLGWAGICVKKAYLSINWAF